MCKISRIFLGLGLLTTLAVFPIGSLQAQEHPGCFIVNKRGELIELPELCPTVEPVMTGAVSAEVSQESRESTQLIYADAYCEGRAQGKTHRQAGDYATNAMIEYTTLAELPTDMVMDMIDKSWYQQAQAASQTLCPNLQPTGSYN